MNTDTDLDVLEKNSILNDQTNEENPNISPLIWRRLATGLKVIDLLPKHFEAVINIILNYYVTENVVFKNTNFLNDPESVEWYKGRLMDCMRERCSILAVKESNDEIVGIFLLKTYKKSDCGRIYNKTTAKTGKTYSSIIRFIHAMQRKVDIFEQFKCNIYLRFYLLCVIPEFRTQRIGFQLMITGMDVARYLEISVVMGIMDNHKLQDNCKKLGFDILYETTYKKYHDEDQHLIFCDCGPGNYTCALMGGVLPPIIETVVEKKKSSVGKNKKKKKGAKTKKK